MEDNHSNRAGLLPKGCKDLIDVSRKNPSGCFSIWVRLPNVNNRDIELTVQDKHLIVVARPAGDEVPIETKVAVPDDFSLAKTRAFHVYDRLLIIIPRHKAG